VELIALELEGYRQFLEPVHLEFPHGLTGICGPNGVGKSKLIEAIGFALYGPTTQVLPAGDHKKDLPTHGVAQPSTRVELRLGLRGQTLRVVRTLSTASLTLEDGRVLADTPSGVSRKVIELLRLSPAAYMGTFVARQRDVAGLLDQDPQDRTRLVNRMVGISQIETALRLARDERGRRQQGATLAERALGLPLAEAEVQEQSAASSAAAAIADADGAERDLAVAGAALEEARDAAEQARLDEQRVVGLDTQLAELIEHDESLHRELAAVEQRIDRSAEAVRRTEESVRLLADGEGVAAELRNLERDHAGADLGERIESVRDTLADLDARAKDLARLQGQAAEVAARQQEATAATGRVRTMHAAKRQQVHTARAALESVQRQRATAVELGEAGACEACGQRYGEGLADALDHFATEIDRHQGLLTTLEAEERSQQDQVEDLEHAERELAAAHADLVGQIALLHEIPGRLAAAHAELTALTAEVDPSARAYDPLRHAEVAERARELAAAADLVEQLAGSVADGPVAAEDRRGLEEKIVQLDERRADADAAKAALQRGAAERAASIGGLEAAVQAEAAARTRCSAMTLVAATRQRDLDRAQTNLDAARERTRTRDLAIADLLVGERTADVLSRLLTDITAEARPRIAELMDMWARSLFSARFKSVLLAEDYRIRADNGSGEHDLGHFSGGEQTILSVILRVAISLFCRERAGFDTGFLILDEVFGDQDAEHRVLLLEFLNEIQREYHQVLVVNHVEDVAAMLDSSIDVRRTGPNTSTAEARQA
jgi:DNA repair exonuclease SbcCD ATPase subunit